MKSSQLLSVCAVFILMLSACRKKELRGDLVIKNVAVINVADGTVAEGMDVVIVNDRITELVESRRNTSYKAKQLIDASGQFLIPGLWDMHTHTWWAYKEFFPLLMANGITGIREMWGEPDSIQKIRTGIASGTIAGPQIISSGAIIDGNPPLWEGSAVADSPGKAREIVRAQKAKGADFIKVYSYLERDVYFAIADECKKLGIPFGGHLPFRVSLEEAIQSGQSSLEHFFGVMDFCSTEKAYLSSAMRKAGKNDSLFDARNYSTFVNRMQFEMKTFDSSKLPALISLLSGSNLWICPTMVATQGSIDRATPGFKPRDIISYMPGFAIEGWEPRTDPASIKSLSRNRKTDSAWYDQTTSLFRKLKDGGVKFLAGTDYPNPHCYPGFSLHDELRLFVEKGRFTPLEALQAATINPAVFFKMDKDLGTVETGKKANLLLLKANPLSNINNTKAIEGVILQGKFFPSSILKDSLERKTRSAATTGH